MSLSIYIHSYLYCCWPTICNFLSVCIFYSGVIEISVPTLEQPNDKQLFTWDGEESPISRYKYLRRHSTIHIEPFTVAKLRNKVSSFSTHPEKKWLDNFFAQTRFGGYPALTLNLFYLFIIPLFFF